MSLVYHSITVRTISGKVSYLTYLYERKKKTPWELSRIIPMLQLNRWPPFCLLSVVKAILYCSMRVFQLNPLPSQHLRCKRKTNISTTRFPVIVTSIYILLLTGCYNHVQSKTPAKPNSEQPWFPESFPSEIHNQYFVLMLLTYAFRGQNECLASGKIEGAFRHLAWAT